MTRVGFIGTGRMGSALIRGFISKGLLKKENVRVFDKEYDRAHRLGLTTEYSAFEVVEKSDVVFICVKPQDMEIVLSEIRDIAGTRLVVCIAAGISCNMIESWLREARVVRVMPNTPALIYELAGGYCLGSRARQEDGLLIGKLLNSIGVAYRVPEELMDAVTGLSGSGPAYVYYAIAAMIDAGMEQGLSEEVSRNLVLQTFRGAANMVMLSKKEPIQLIEEVKSPGGTTIEGLRVLDDMGVDKAFSKAVAQATKRSKELGIPPEKRRMVARTKKALKKSKAEKIPETKKKRPKKKTPSSKRGK